jgi:hypothetical protein
VRGVDGDFGIARAKFGNKQLVYFASRRCERRHSEINFRSENVKLSTARRRTLVILITLIARVAPVDCALAAERKRPSVTDVYAYGPNGPNRSYRVGPRTRVFVTRRSWLDAGTEVLPGERKFSDYAFPPGYSFARENGNRPLDRQPLNPASDLGGFPQRIPF